MPAAARTDNVFPGARISPSDPRYPAMVLGFNPRWVGTPKYIQLCGHRGVNWVRYGSAAPILA
jgi:hypothetical protein